jgi:hypothetical protein
MKTNERKYLEENFNMNSEITLKQYLSLCEETDVDFINEDTEEFYTYVNNENLKKYKNLSNLKVIKINRDNIVVFVEDFKKLYEEN